MDMDKAQFLHAVKIAAITKDESALRVLEKQNPKWFREELARITKVVSDRKGRLPAAPKYKPKSKSELKRDQYMAIVKEKRKAGLNH